MDGGFGGGHGDDDKMPSGLALLRESFEHSAGLGVRTSCTVRLDEKVWCVRDGGAWKECGDKEGNSEVWSLTGEIKRLWSERN
jgi:hypothetical protein